MRPAPAPGGRECAAPGGVPEVRRPAFRTAVSVSSRAATFLQPSDNSQRGQSPPATDAKEEQGDGKADQLRVRLRDPPPHPPRPAQPRRGTNLRLPSPA